MSIPVYICFIIASFLASLYTVYREKRFSYITAFCPFLLASAGVEIAGWLLSDQKMSTIMLYNIFTTLEFVFYLWVLREVITRRIARKIIVYLMAIYPVLSFLEIFSRIQANGFHAETYVLGCVLVVALSIYYFFELFQLPHSVNLVRTPAFWICSGLLFYYTCTFPAFGLANFLSKLPNVNDGTLAAIIDLLNILLYSSFAIALLCKFKVRKSTL